MALECLADKAGVVDWDLDKIHEVLGDGVEFNRLDVKAMGPDHVVWMDGGCQLMLSQFMKNQCCGTLSRKAPPHKPIWQAIAKWWGQPEKADDPEPFLAFFSRKCIFRHAPRIKHEDHGHHEELWKIRMLEELAVAETVKIPETLPVCVFESLTKVFNWRKNMALRCRLRTESVQWTWTKEQAELMIEMVVKFVSRFTQESIELQLNNLILGTSAYLNPPPMWKSNLLPNKKEDTNE